MSELHEMDVNVNNNNDSSDVLNNNMKHGFDVSKELPANHAAFLFNELSKFQRQNLLCDVELPSSTVDPVHAHKVVLMSAQSSFDTESACGSSPRHSSFDSEHPLSDDDEVFTANIDQLEEAYSPDENNNDKVKDNEGTSEEDLCLKRRLSTLNQLRLDGRCCDVILTSDVDGREYVCHRVVLAACSDYFRAMFTASMLESEQQRITVHGIGEELSKLVEFMYTGEIDLESGCDVIQLLGIAVYYQIQTLVSRCICHLIRKITLDDCCALAWIGRELSVSQLTESALQFVSRNLHQLAQVEHIELLNADDLVRCLENVDYSDQLASKAELGVLRSCLRWCRANMDHELRHKEVMSQVRFALISKPDIDAEYENVDPTSESKAIVEWMNAASTYHNNIYKQPLLQDKSTQLRGDSSNYVLVDGVISQNPVRVQTESSRITIANNFDEVIEIPVEETEKAIRDPFHNVVELGGFIYALGGTRVKNSGFSQAVERYDPRLDVWIDVAPMLQERADFTSCVLDGCIIVAGGRGRRRYLNACEKYDPNTNTWTKIARLPQAMYMAAAVVSNGTLYMSGGFNEYEALDEMIRYNQQRNKWERLPGMMMKCRGYHVMVESPLDGRLWVVGGIDNPFAGRNVWKIEAWNIELGRWQYVGEVLPIKMFTSTMRLNGHINNRNNITVFPVTHPHKYGAIEYYADKSMWLESKNPTPVFDIEVDAVEEVDMEIVED